MTCCAILVISLPWNSIQEEVVGRLENSILYLEENRTAYSQILPHPNTDGKSDPKFFTKIYRYSMEDVQMKCDCSMLYLADGRPGHDFVSWRHNGVQIHPTDRHHHQITFKEIPEDDSSYHTQLRQRGVSQYQCTATLIIHLLRGNEFGNYTCHVKKHLALTPSDFGKNYHKLQRFLSEQDTNLNSNINPQKTEKRAEQFTQFEREQPQQHAIKHDYAYDDTKQKLFMDAFTLKEEFRLIKMGRKRELIRSPPGSILSWTSSYWYVPTDDQKVMVDYIVNGVPYLDLCPDTLHGCSMLLSLYWALSHETGYRFGLPPLQLFTIWKEEFAISADRFHLFQCMCENAYGYHQFRYVRRYYNTTSRREQIVEIVHPHSLLVTPSDKHLLHFFANRSECVPYVDEAPFDPSYDLQIIQDFARLAVTCFAWLEWSFVNVLLSVGLCLLPTTSWFLSRLGCLIKQLTLQGSMTFDYTALLEIRKSIRLYQCSENVKYNIYLSYSEADVDQTRVHEDVLPFLENRLQLNVCARNRGSDIPCYKPKIQGIEIAIETSRKIIVFLSSSYLQDRFLTDMEIPIISECYCGRERDHHQDVLVIKLDSCPTPLWAFSFEIHDWTSSSLTVEDHLRKVMRWIQPREHSSLFKSNLDYGVSLMPLGLCFALFAVLSYFVRTY